MIRAVIFDFDGTLADTAMGIVSTMYQTFRELELPLPSEAAIRDTIGLPLAQAMQILQDLDAEHGEAAASVYRRLFPSVGIHLVTFFPGVHDVLKALNSKGIRVAIATSRGTPSLVEILANNHASDLVETFVTSSDNLPPKPSPGLVLALLERMGLDSGEVLVVGDTTFDIEMGNSAGCRTCAVTYGNHSREKLMTASPTYIIDAFPQLADVVAAC